MCMYVYSVFVLSCVGRGLEMSWSFIQGVLPYVYKRLRNGSRKPKPRPGKGCRATGGKKLNKVDSFTVASYIASKKNSVQYYLSHRLSWSLYMGWRKWWKHYGLYYTHFFIDMVLDHFLPSIQPQSFFEWTRTNLYSLQRNFISFFFKIIFKLL
jgi:hypothetical protein